MITKKQPTMDSSAKSDLVKQLDEALNEIRPHLIEDGGDIEVVDVTDDMVVKLKWLGNCEACKISYMTMATGIQHVIKNRFPQIKEVEAIN